MTDNKKPIVSAVVSQEMWDAIEELCAKEELSRSRIVYRLIKLGLQTMRPKEVANER